jgi:hypothetical protein
MGGVRPAIRSALVGAVVGGLSLGCGTSAPTSAPVTPSPTAAPTGPFAIRAGTLTPGLYTTTAFQPTLTFSVGGGWFGMFPDDSDEIALNDAREGMFAITRVSQVIDPETRVTAIPVPDDLIGWFTTHPQLIAEAPSPVTIAGLAGQSVDVVVADNSEPDIFAYESGNMYIPTGFKVRYIVLPLDGPDLTIVIGAAKDDFAATLERAQVMLDSLAMVAGG